MVRMTEMSDETPECKGLKVPRSEMGVWVKAQAVRFSRNGCYETPWHVTGVSKLSGPEGTPKGMYVQIPEPVASFFAGIGNSQLGRHDVCSGVGEGILSECQSYYQSEQTACYRRTAATGGKVANLANVKE